MADVKWIKIVTDIFDDEKILFIEQLPEADSIIVIWFKLLTLAGKINNGGVLLFNERIPYTDEMLSTIFRRPINTVRLALKTFQQFEMVEIINDTITIPNWSKHQTLDQLEERKEYMKNYMREYREKQRMLAGGEENKVNSKVNSVPNSKANVNSLDIDIEEDIEIDIEDIDTTIEKVAAVPHKEIVELYNSICISFNPVKQVTNKRKGSMNARFRENDCNIEIFKRVFAIVQSSNFLKKGWDSGGKADFDWIMKPTNFVKILEGKYGGEPNGEHKGHNGESENRGGPSEESIRLERIAKEQGLLDENGNITSEIGEIDF